MKFSIRTYLDGQSVSSQDIEDPFVRHTVHVEDRLVRWLRWPRVKHEVVVTVDGDREAIQSVMQLIHERNQT